MRRIYYCTLRNENKYSHIVNYYGLQERWNSHYVFIVFKIKIAAIITLSRTIKTPINFYYITCMRFLGVSLLSWHTSNLKYSCSRNGRSCVTDLIVSNCRFAVAEIPGGDKHQKVTRFSRKPAGLPWRWISFYKFTFIWL